MFFDQILCDSNDVYSLVIEDDDRVCYAYLMENESIIGDVWLYNVSAAPDKMDWSSAEVMPFLNPAEYVDCGRIVEPIKSSKDLCITWNSNKQKLEEVSIYIKNILVAKIKPDIKPGWSLLASKDGPLAKVLM